jgi:hypothetical protein
MMGMLNTPARAEGSLNAVSLSPNPLRVLRRR